MNEMMKFEARQVAGEISANFDEIEAMLAEQLKQYEGVVFTEDTKSDAKKTVASLRRTKKDIDDSRKEVKALWMEPYNRFEDRVKSLMAMVDRPINLINGQVEAFEEKRRAERNAEIEKIYEEEIGDLADFLPLYKIRNEKWLNAGTTVKKIREEMAEIIKSVRSGKAAIEAMQSDAVPEALKKFQADLNLPEAIAHINRYEAGKAEILKREEEKKRQEEERKRQAEIDRIRAEERQRVAKEEEIRRNAEAQAKEAIQSVNEEQAAPLSLPQSKKAVYTVVGTEEELAELELAMTSLGLYYERKYI